MPLSDIVNRLNFYKRLAEAERENIELKRQIFELLKFNKNIIVSLESESKKIKEELLQLEEISNRLQHVEIVAKTNIEHYANEYFKLKNELRLNQKVKVINLDLPSDLNIGDNDG